MERDKTSWKKLFTKVQKLHNNVTRWALPTGRSWEGQPRDAADKEKLDVFLSYLQVERLQENTKVQSELAQQQKEHIQSLIETQKENTYIQKELIQQQKKYTWAFIFLTVIIILIAAIQAYFDYSTTRPLLSVGKYCGLEENKKIIVEFPITNGGKIQATIQGEVICDGGICGDFTSQGISLQLANISGNKGLLTPLIVLLEGEKYSEKIIMLVDKRQKKEEFSISLNYGCINPRYCKFVTSRKQICSYNYNGSHYIPKLDYRLGSK